MITTQNLKIIYPEINMNDILVNAEVVANSEDLSPVVRQLARTIISSGYITIGNWLKSLDYSDIEYLSEIVEIEVDDDLYEDACHDIVLMTLMLAHSEGVYPETMEELSTFTGLFKIFVVGVYLEHLKMAIAHYDKMSFGGDHLDELPFERLD